MWSPRSPRRSASTNESHAAAGVLYLDRQFLAFLFAPFALRLQLRQEEPLILEQRRVRGSGHAACATVEHLDLAQRGRSRTTQQI